MTPETPEGRQPILFSRSKIPFNDVHHLLRAARTPSLAALLALAVLVWACAGPSAYEQKVHRMSDADLKAAYLGLNDRLKDVDQGIQNQRREDDTELDRTQQWSTFCFGGPGYDVVQRRRAIERELHRRGIRP